MKKSKFIKYVTVLLLAFNFSFPTAYAQTPEQFKYQAVLRDVSGNIIASQAKTVVIDILQGSATGTNVFTETHTTTTTAQGIITLNIGSVNTTGLGAIDWAADTYFIKITVGGVEMGTSQLLSVPYAINAKNAETADYNSLTNLPTFATIATSGSYVDLTNKPANIDEDKTDDVTLTGNQTIAGLKYFSSQLSVNGTMQVSETSTNKSLFLRQDENYSYISNKANFLGQGSTANGMLFINGEAGISLNYGASGVIGKTGLCLTNFGNIGINTWPAARLHVYDTIGNNYSDISKLLNLNIHNGSNMSIQFYSLRKAAGTDWYDVSHYIQQIVDGFNMGFIEFNTGHATWDIALGTSNVARLTIQNDGKINANSNNIINVPTPINPTDAANKAYIDASNSHYIGESYDGGIVFYVYDNGQHGLIAATVDQSTGIRWHNGTATTTNAVRDGIGAGKFNTERIIANQGAGSYAAQLCANYQGGNYGDWYLPSKYELNLLYLQKAVVGGFAITYYWSSSEYNVDRAWDQHFNIGSPNGSYKSDIGHVRAIRAF